jgi:hypothetical protein
MTPMNRPPDERQLWTGVIYLELLDPHDYGPAGCLEVQVHRDDLYVKGEARMLAVIDRERFACWVDAPHVRYVADDTAWTATAPGHTELAFGGTRYVLVREPFMALKTALRRLTDRPALAKDDSMRPAGVGPAGRTA